MIVILLYYCIYINLNKKLLYFTGCNYKKYIYLRNIACHNCGIDSPMEIYWHDMIFGEHASFSPQLFIKARFLENCTPPSFCVKTHSEARNAFRGLGRARPKKLRTKGSEKSKDKIIFCNYVYFNFM